MRGSLSQALSLDKIPDITETDAEACHIQNLVTTLETGLIFYCENYLKNEFNEGNIQR